MGLTSSEGGNDGIQIGTIVFCTVISLIIAMMAPFVAPAYDTDTGYTYSDVFLERQALEQFTGESMTNNAPWVLDAVYTPWNPGMPVQVEDDTGWIYGTSVNYSKAGYMGTTIIGATNTIYLDPDHKSTTPLAQITATQERQVEVVSEWYYEDIGGLIPNPLAAIVDYFGGSTTKLVTEEYDVNSWSFTGYRYSFDPMLKIDYTDPTNPAYSEASQSDAKLSIVWYEDQYGQGLSSGLILWNDKTHGLVANLEVGDIIDQYNAASNYSSKYKLDYEGVTIYVNIRFDQDVIASGVDLAEAFDTGRWSLAISAVSMDNFMDIKSSNSLSTSAGNLVDTYSQIMTFDMPNVPFLWQMVLWILCVLPLMMAVMLFFTRSLITAGVGAGILGSILAIGLM